MPTTQENLEEALANAVELSAGHAEQAAKHERAAVEAVKGKQDKFDVGSGLKLENGVLSAEAQKIEVDAVLSATSENPVQNKVVAAALDGKVSKGTFYANSVRMETNSDGKSITLLNNSQTKAELLSFNFADDCIKIEPYAGANFGGIEYTIPLNGGGGSAEGLTTWTDDGTAGIDTSKTFVGTDSTHILHAGGQIHGAKMLSGDTNKRLYVPFDLMQNDEERYLMAAAVWNGQRNILGEGDTTTFVHNRLCRSIAETTRPMCRTRFPPLKTRLCSGKGKSFGMMGQPPFQSRLSCRGRA